MGEQRCRKVGHTLPWVNLGETILMVGSPAMDEVSIKSCWWQEVLIVGVTSDNDTTTNGLSEFTTRQNPNPKNSNLFYGSNTMLREKKYPDSH